MFVKLRAWAASRRVAPQPEVGDLTDELLGTTELAEAFDELSPRWQFVVVQVDIHRMNPASLAEVLGVAPDAAVALSYHAHDHLRLAYLRHLDRALAPECAAHFHRLGAWVLQRLTPPERAEVEAHLRGCERCTQAAVALARVVRRWGPAPCSGTTADAARRGRCRWWHRSPRDAGRPPSEPGSSS